MGFFNFNKPGKGVPDIDPDLPRWKLFFKLYLRKFTQILGLNSLYVLFSIPSFILSYIMSFYVLNKNFDNYFGFTIEGNDLFLMVLPRIIVALIMVIIPVAAIGPVHAGITYILRNWGQEKHAYIWWDFKDQFKANFKQGSLVTIINLLAIFIFGIAISIYLSFSAVGATFLTYAAIGFISLTMCLFLCMNFYIYPLMVTYDMKLLDIYKTAYAFAFMRIIPNLLVLLAIFLIFIITYLFQPWIGILLTMFILPITILYGINFYVDPIIRDFEDN